MVSEIDEKEFSRKREFSFTTQHFIRVKDELYNYAGIVLADHKQNMAYNRLVKRLRELKFESFDDYFDLLDSDPAEFTHFINTMTTNLTSFFREQHHFEFLDQVILPDIAQQNIHKLRIWSAGCSFGEEPYSIAMTLLDSAVDLSNWDVRLLATDIDSKVLSNATAGVYEHNRVELLSQEQLHKWFLKGVGDQDGQVKVRQPLQDMITYRHLNLMGDWPMSGPFDLIFCRNVMIYFDTQAKEQLLDRMADLLKPDGYLFIGHSEAIPRNGHRYRLIGQTIYQKVY